MEHLQTLPDLKDQDMPLSSNTIEDQVMVSHLPNPDECEFDHILNNRELSDRQRQIIELMGRDPNRAWSAMDFHTIGMSGGYSGIGSALKCLLKRDLVEIVHYDRNASTRLRPNYGLPKKLKIFYQSRNTVKQKQRDEKQQREFEEKMRMIRRKLEKAVTL